ncbi:MAG TPA: acyl-ACP--UDP-N-acetylglucosamine O-acyltransferase [Planctomycetota bacterium]|nr:acyl-ACP--UDP-N-acetylglucosamine O-acyltransferase [Planctomycetota bacterium]
MGIHPTAVVAATAVLADEVDIGPYCVVGGRVRLGARTRLHSHVAVQGDTTIGADCEIFPFAVLGETPQDKKIKGEAEGVLRIGDGNRIREHVTIHGGTPFGNGTTRIGDHNLLLVGSHVGHDATIGNHCVLTNSAMVAGHALIGDRAILGAMVGVHQFARVGQLAMIGAGAMVSHDAPPFALVQGDRARLVGVNVVGLARNGYSAEQKAVIKRVYRLLFWRAGNLAQKVEQVRSSALGREDVGRLVLDFVSSSHRGVCMPRAGRFLTSGDGKETVDATTG